MKRIVLSIALAGLATAVGAAPLHINWREGGPLPRGKSCRATIAGNIASKKLSIVSSQL